MNAGRFRTAFESLVKKWCEYREALAELRELEALEPELLAATAAENGLSVQELREIVVNGSGAPDLMIRMMEAHGLNPETVRRRHPLVMRDIEGLCARCTAKGRCRRELDAGTAVEYAEELCPNAYTFERLVETGPL